MIQWPIKMIKERQRPEKTEKTDIDSVGMEEDDSLSLKKKCFNLIGIFSLKLLFPG